MLLRGKKIQTDKCLTEAKLCFSEVTDKNVNASLSVKLVFLLFFYIKISGGIPIRRTDTEFDLQLGGTAVPVAVGLPRQLQHARTAPAIFFS